MGEKGVFEVEEEERGEEGESGERTPPSLQLTLA